MSDQASREDKRLPASERKLRNARLEGQVARSRDFGHVMIMGCTFGTVLVFAGFMREQSILLLRAGLRFNAEVLENAESTVAWVSELGGIGLWIVAPVAVAGVFAGIVAAVVPGGIILTLKPLQPKFNRLSPLSGIKRIVSRGHLMDSLKLASLVLLLTVIGGWYLLANFEDFAALSRLPLPTALGSAPDLVVYGAAALISLLVLAAFIDVPMQFFRHRNELKMTFQEARQENKETDGDPQQKARQRQRQREIGSARMMAKVPTANVIINNPTHYSVALRYEEGGSGAPVVVAKGADHIALRIRVLALEHGIAQVEAPPLARALYAHVPLDQEIPASLYSAVAQVLAYVFSLRSAGVTRAPETPQKLDLQIPPELDPAGAA